jgi:hypothetical protein
MLIQSEEGAMSQVITIEVNLPDELAQFRLPAAVNARLHDLLDRQDNGVPRRPRRSHGRRGLDHAGQSGARLRLVLA